MPEQNLLIESVQAVHQHTDSLLNLLMKVCNKMSLSDITTECIQMSAALKDTKQIFTSLHESSSAAAAEHRVFEESMRKYAKEQATAESQGVESRLKTSTGKLEAEMKEKLKNLETRFLETDSGLDASSPRPKGDGNIKKVMNRISDFEAQVSSQLQAYTSDVDKKLSFLNSRRTTDEPDSIQGLSRDLDAVKYDVGELKDLLNGAKGDTAQVKRIVLACERDMEDFTAAMDAVNVDLDEMRARVDSTRSIITSRQRVEATVTAEISTMRLDMGDMQEALKAHDAWMEDVSQSLQEVHERCEYLNMEISGVNQNFQAKLDAKTDIASWNDMNDDIDASIRTVRDMASSLRLEVDSRRRRVDEDLLRMRSEVSSLDEKINSKTVDILRESSENNNALSRRLDERQEHCNSLEAMIVQHRQTSQEMQGKIDVQKEEMESRISSVHSAMAKQGEDLQRSTSERMESLEQQQNKGSKDSQKHLNAMDLRLAALQGATGECKRDIGKMRDEVNSLTVKSAAHDVDVAKNSDDIRKLERQRVEDDQRHKQEFDGIYDELDQKVTEKNFQRLEDDTAKLTRGAPKKAASAVPAEAATNAEAEKVEKPKGIDWATLNAKLPYEKTPEQKAKRMQMFKEMDLNHSNKLSLAEVSAAMEKILEEAGQELKVPEVIRLAFNVAKVAAQQAGLKGSEDYVEKLEFRLLLQYTREYFELYQLFSGMSEKAGNKYVGLEEFKKAVPLLKDWGVTEVTLEKPEETFQSIDKDESGQIRFEDFAEWAMKQNLDSPDDDEAAPDNAEAPAEAAAEAVAA